MSTHDVSALTGATRQDSRQSSHACSPLSASENSQQRSSQLSQYSQAAVAPAVAVKSRFRNSAGSAPSPYARSVTSSPPSSPLAHEILLPCTPPPLLSKSSRTANPPLTPSPLTYDPEIQSLGNRPEGVEEHTTHMHRILGRAKAARDAWRRHQLELKHEKLKQSIRVLGPTDPGVTAGYVRREGRRPGEEDTDPGRMPGYMVTGPV